eukprot:982133_1
MILNQRLLMKPSQMKHNGGEDLVKEQESVSERRPVAMRLDSAPQVVMNGITTAEDSGSDHESDASEDSLYTTRGNAFTTRDQTTDGMNVTSRGNTSWKYYVYFFNCNNS